MTNQTTPDVTDDDRRLAREWAESIESATNSVEPTTNTWSDRAVAAARVILAVLPTPPPTTAKENPAPRTIPADKVQAVADWLLNEEMANGGLDEKIAPQLAARAQMCWEARAKLQALLRPTLADMSEEERAACIRMQCDTAPNRSVRGFIADIYPGGCRVIERDTWQWRSCSDDMVTPRPDLPRLEWPGDQKPEPEPAPALPGEWRLADHPDHGCVIVANPTPNRAGNVCFVMPAVDGDPRGFAWHLCSPNVLTYIDQEDDQ